MSKIKVLLTKKYFNSDKNYINDKVGDIAELIDTNDYSEQGLLKEAENADVLFGSFVTENLLRHASNLKLIQIPWTGVDNLNYEVLRKFSFPVCNSHSNSQAVAEHAIALLLSLIKKIPYHDRLLRQGDWNRPKIDKEPEYDNFSDSLQDKTVVFIGYGSIAKKIAGFLDPFKCKLIAIDESQNEYKELTNKMKPENIDEALKIADIVFVTVPFTEKTKDLINETKISLLKPSSYLINISRGSIVNEKALFEALKNKIIAGAGIDVWYNYPKDSNPTHPSSNYPFYELPNIVMSPHRAGFIKGELPHLDDATENIIRLHQGRELINKINLENKY
ncbi:MAG: hypothetical protein JXR90_07665 [Spirochaetes bacterium]|nr:hypothetical protein [Spirochaetota bacterium]